MNAQFLVSRFEAASEDTLPPPVAPVITADSVVVTNAHNVTLHRGSAPVTFKGDPKVREPDFQKTRQEGADILPQDQGGVSVSVLGSDHIDELQVAHDGLVGACRHRLIASLNDVRQSLGTVSKSQLNNITGDKKSSYCDVIKRIAECGIPAFQEIDIPFCYVKIANPFYQWAQLESNPTSHPDREKPHHCLVRVKMPTPLTTVDNMARCKDGDWVPCSFLLTAAAKPGDKMSPYDFDRESATGVTVAVLDALDYLIDDFAQGGDWIGVQEAFEICVYLTKIESGDLVFSQSRHSGLEKHPRLAALVELAVHFGFWIQVYEDSLYIEHDITVALHGTLVDVRLVKSSLIALFDSGIHPHSSKDPQDFRPLSKPALSFMKHLLRMKNAIEVCNRLREQLKVQIELVQDERFDEIQPDWSTESFPVLEEISPSSDQMVVNRLLDNYAPLPLVARGTATLMITYMSHESSARLERCLTQSKEVQAIFSVVLERHLLIENIEKRNRDAMEHASNFITAVQSVVDVPEYWPLRVKTPTLKDPVSIAVVRIKRELDVLEAKRVGISLHNLLHTVNTAVWRIEASHIIWCTSKKYGFDLRRSVHREYNEVSDEAIDDWVYKVIKGSASKFEDAGMFHRNGQLLSRDRSSTSFVVLITWDESLCRHAVESCVQELPRLRISQDDFFHDHWTVVV